MDTDEAINDLIEWIDGNILGLNYCDERDKISSSILEVLKRIPSEDRNILMFKRGVRFVAPIINCTSDMFAIYPRPSQNKIDFPQPINVWLVCLNSDILTVTKDETIYTKDETIYTIAHELAHVFLEHSKYSGTSTLEGLSEREEDAEKQVEKWGFKSELRKSPSNYLYGDGSI